MKNSNLYWLRRLNNAQDIIEKELEKELIKGYQSALGELLDEINKMYEVIIAEQASGDVLLSHLYSYNRYGELMKQLTDKLLMLGVQETQVIEDSLIEMYKEVGLILSLRYNLEGLLNLTDEQIKDRIKRVWTADGLSFSDRIWKDKIKLKEEVSKTLVESLQTGKHPYKFADEMAKKMDTSKFNTRRILRTELAHTQEASALQRYKDAGVTQVKIKCGDYKKRIKYNGKGKASSFYYIPCEECKSYDGKEYMIDDPLLPILPRHPNAGALIFL